MLLSNKMKFIGIGCCILPINNQICSVIDIVQDFMPYKKSKIPKMNIIINNTNNEFTTPKMRNSYNSSRPKSSLQYNNYNYNYNNENNKLNVYQRLYDQNKEKIKRQEERN